jgi:ribosome-associated toxin RatA of RatAB toxin-antitoxin module
MPAVHTEMEVPGVSLADVWRVVSDFEQFPALMPNVLSVDVIGRDGDAVITTWRVVLEGSEMTWDERDTFVPHERITFEQVDGDLDVFRGEWTLAEREGGVLVTLTVEFDLGIPSLAMVLNPVGVKAIDANSREMLRAIGDRFRALEAA